MYGLICVAAVTLILYPIATAVCRRLSLVSHFLKADVPETLWTQVHHALAAMQEFRLNGKEDPTKSQLMPQWSIECGFKTVWDLVMAH